MTAVGFLMSAISVPAVILSLFGLTMAAVVSCPPRRCSGPTLHASMSAAAAAVGFATINSIGNLGGFVSPYMLGLITDSTGSRYSHVRHHGKRWHLRTIDADLLQEFRSREPRGFRSTK